MRKIIYLVLLLYIVPLFAYTQKKVKNRNKTLEKVKTIIPKVEQPFTAINEQEIKFFSDFVKRFNYEYYNTNTPFNDSLRSIYSKELWLKKLFNEDDNRLKSSDTYKSLVERFIFEVTEKNLIINKQANLEAELPIITEIGESTDTLKVQLKKFYTDKQASYWQVVDVTPPKLLKIDTLLNTFADTLKRQTLYPNEHEVRFLSLLQGIKVYNGIAVFANKEVNLNQKWQLVEKALQTKKMIVLFNGLPQLTFKLFNWQLTLNYYNKASDSDNAGWLISDLKLLTFPPEPNISTINPTINRDSVYHYLMSWKKQLNVLSTRNDSLGIKNQQEYLFKHFGAESLIVPNWLIMKKLFFKQHPQTTFKVFLDELPTFFWEGLHIDILAEKLQIDSLHLVNTNTYNWQITFPYTFRGLLAQSKQNHILNDTLVCTIQAQWINNHWENQVFKSIITKGIAVPEVSEILTLAKAQEIALHLRTAVMTLLNEQNSDSTRNIACETLNKYTEKKVVFFIQKGDKVIDSLGINNCRATKVYKNKKLRKLHIKSFDLIYINSFHEGANGFVIGSQSVLEQVNPQKKENWYVTKQENIPVQVDSQQAKSKNHLLFVSKVIIQI